MAQARDVLTQGADIIVAQGTEAGGHGAARSTLPLVPAVVDLVAASGREVPVVAAGGIGDGRGLAAALMLGADGVLMGSRFYAAEESLAPAAGKARISPAAATTPCAPAFSTSCATVIGRGNIPDGRCAIASARPGTATRRRWPRRPSGRTRAMPLRRQPTMSTPRSCSPARHRPDPCGRARRHHSRSGHRARPRWR